MHVLRDRVVLSGSRDSRRAHRAPPAHLCKARSRRPSGGVPGRPPVYRDGQLAFH